jgi:hypothetical protein
MGFLRSKKRDTIEVIHESAPSTPKAHWPSMPPLGYLGQLRDSYQGVLASSRADLQISDCTFYHAVDLPNGKSVTGPWDLRGGESDYLGGVDVKGKRVLELGPSTGHLSYWMEKHGAEVVSFDVGYDAKLDVQPGPVDEMPELHTDHLKMIDGFQNSWWYLHRQYQSKVKMVYGNIYDLPGDMGTFDVATYGSILLHLRSPISALEQGARRTTDKIIVTDTWPEGDDTLMDNVMRPFPNGEDGRWLLWWLISAGAVVEMMKILGFDKTTVTRHTQLHQHGHVSEAEFVKQPMYTVVGERTKRSFAL